MVRFSITSTSLSFNISSTVNDFILYCSAHFFAASGNLSAQAMKLILLK